jgi:hypothetical protein
MPLAAVIQEKTNGSPFFVKEMLDSWIISFEKLVVELWNS